MSIYDKASLVQIPSGVKSGTLYNVVPNTADGDFDFTRGSTATRVNKDGLIETVASGVPRLDYPLLDGVVQDCPALLLEPQRRNDIPYSEDFSQYSDSLGADIFNNTVISPDGTLNGSTIGFGGSDNSRIFISTSTSSNTYTFTLYAKSSTSKKFRFRISDTSGTVFSNDFTTTSEWQRFSYEFTGDPNTCAICNSSDASVGSIDIFGFQLEAGSYPTSYIPTSGSAVTRSADVCNGAQADFNDSEGVLFAEISALANDGTSRRISISDGTNNNRIELIYSTSDEVSYQLISGGSYQGGVGVGVQALNSNKVAAKYKLNDLALWVNGFELTTDTSSTMPSGLDTMRFEDGAGGNDFYGKTKQLMTFNEALSDTELENLTSWDSFREMATEQLYTIE